MILRRIYLYTVSAVGLLLLTIGLAALGATILVFAFGDAAAEFARPQLAIFTAMTLMSAPVWGIHQWFARRYARRDPSERASALRRLYFYAALLGLALAAMVPLSQLASLLLSAPLDQAKISWLQVTQLAWVAVVLATGWAIHLRVVQRDRALVGEVSGSATLRRFSMYPVLLIALLVLLSGLSDLIMHSWLRAINAVPEFAPPDYLAAPAGALLAALLVWGFHARALQVEPIADDDRQSTLRALELFIAIFIVIVFALLGASQILYYAVAKVIGVDNPGGAGNNLLANLAAPGSQFAIYGATWVLLRRRLHRDTAGGEARLQAGIRRLYTNLASLVSLGAASFGAGAVLWVIFEQLESRLIGVEPPGWKDGASLGITLLVVGIGTWLSHWRPAPAGPERVSLSRRLYLYATLLGSMLVLLGSGVAVLNTVLRQTFSAHPTIADSQNLDFGRALAVVLVALGVGMYHWRVMRTDIETRPARQQPDAAPGLAAPLRRYEITLDGVSDVDFRRALDSLAAPARYTLREVVEPGPRDAPTPVHAPGPRTRVTG